MLKHITLQVPVHFTIQHFNHCLFYVFLKCKLQLITSYAYFFICNLNEFCTIQLKHRWFKGRIWILNLAFESSTCNNILKSWIKSQKNKKWMENSFILKYIMPLCLKRKPKCFACTILRSGNMDANKIVQIILFRNHPKNETVKIEISWVHCNKTR